MVGNNVPENVSNVTVVWDKDPISGKPAAWYKKVRIIPSETGVTPSDNRYFVRKDHPEYGSMEVCDLAKSPTGYSYIANPVAFLETIAPGLLEPIRLFWKRDEKGNMRARVQVAKLGLKLVVYPGDDNVIHRLGEKKAARWNNRMPEEDETIVCWILWRLTSQGYLIGHAYRVDERTKPYRDSMKRQVHLLATTMLI